MSDPPSTSASMVSRAGVLEMQARIDAPPASMPLAEPDSGQRHRNEPRSSLNTARFVHSHCHECRGNSRAGGGFERRRGRAPRNSPHGDHLRPGPTATRSSASVASYRRRRARSGSQKRFDRSSAISASSSRRQGSGSALRSSLSGFLLLSSYG